MWLEWTSPCVENSIHQPASFAPRLVIHCIIWYAFTDLAWYSFNMLQRCFLLCDRPEMRVMWAIMQPIHQICLYVSGGFDQAEFSKDPGQLISIFGPSPAEVTPWHSMTLQTVSVHEGLYSLMFSSDDLGFNTGDLRFGSGTKPHKYTKQHMKGLLDVKQRVQWDVKQSSSPHKEACCFHCMCSGGVSRSHSLSLPATYRWATN